MYKIKHILHLAWPKVEAYNAVKVAKYLTAEKIKESCNELKVGSDQQCIDATSQTLKKVNQVMLVYVYFRILKMTTILRSKAQSAAFTSFMTPTNKSNRLQNKNCSF